MTTESPATTSRIPAPDEATLRALLALEAAGFPPDERWSSRSWRSELEGESFAVLSAPAGAEIVGVIALRLTGEECEVDRLIVEPGRRRQGIGRLLLDAGLETAAASGVTEMILEVRSDNAPAVELYRDHGFRAVNVRRDYYGPGRDAMIMKLTRGGGRWPDR